MNKKIKRIIGFCLIIIFLLVTTFTDTFCIKIGAEEIDKNLEPYYRDYDSNIEINQETSVELDGELITKDNEASNIELNFELKDDGKEITTEITNTLAIVLVLDYSNSMRSNNSIAAAKNGAILFCDKILKTESATDYVQIQVLAYDNTTRIVCDFTNNLQTLTDAITNSDYQAQGTDTYEGLATAATNLNKREETNKVLVLMSDGAPNYDKDGNRLNGNGSLSYYNSTAAENCLELASEIKDNGIEVFTVAYCRSNDTLETFLAGIATDENHAINSSEMAENGGSTTAALIKAFGKVAGDVINYHAESVHLTFKLNENFKFDTEDENYQFYKDYLIAEDKFENIPIKQPKEEEEWVLPSFKLLPTKTADEYAKSEDAKVQEDGSIIIYGVDYAFVDFKLGNEETESEDVYRVLINRLDAKIQVKVYTIKYFIEVENQEFQFIKETKTIFMFLSEEFVLENNILPLNELIDETELIKYNETPEVKESYEINTWEVYFYLKKTPTPTPTNSPTPTPTNTPIPSSTPTPTPTNIPTLTPTPTITDTPSPTPTSTPTPILTETPTPTNTPTPTPQEEDLDDDIPQGDPTIPQTGDINLFVLPKIIIISSLAIIVFFINKKKK